MSLVVGSVSAHAVTEVAFQPVQFLLYSDSFSKQLLQNSTEEIEARQRKGEAYGYKRSSEQEVNQYIQDLYQGTLNTITHEVASEYCATQICGTAPCKAVKGTVLSNAGTQPDLSLPVQGYELMWSQVQNEILIHSVFSKDLKGSPENLVGSYLKQITCTDTPGQRLWGSSMEVEWKADLPRAAVSCLRSPEVNWFGSLKAKFGSLLQVEGQFTAETKALEGVHKGLTEAPPTVARRELVFPSALFYRQTEVKTKSEAKPAVVPARSKYSRRRAPIESCPCQVCPSRERTLFSAAIIQKVDQLVGKLETTGQDTLTYLGFGAGRAGFDVNLLDDVQTRIAESKGIKHLVIVLLDRIYCVQGTFINDEDKRMNSPPHLTWIEDVFPAVVERLREQASHLDHPVNITVVAYQSWSEYASDLQSAMALPPNLVTAVDTFGTNIDDAVKALAHPGVFGQLEGEFFRSGSQWSYPSESECNGNYKRIELVE